MLETCVFECRREDAKIWNLFIKYSVFILSCLNFSHLQSTLHMMQYTYQHVFFSTAQSQFWCILALLPYFVSPLPYLQNMSFEEFFHLGNQTNKKVTQVKIRWIGRVGHRGHVIFGQKPLNTQHGVGRCIHKSSIMKWANALKESSKTFTDAECSLSQHHQLVHWYRWVPRTFT